MDPMQHGSTKPGINREVPSLNAQAVLPYNADLLRE